MALDIRLLKSALRRFLSKINSFTYIIFMLSFIISSPFKKGCWILRIRHSRIQLFYWVLILFCDHLLETFLKMYPPFNGGVPAWWSTSFKRPLFQLKIVANKADKWIAACPGNFSSALFFISNPIFHLKEKTVSQSKYTHLIWWTKKAQQSAKNKLMFFDVVQMILLASSLVLLTDLVLLS